jgi:hypothetical protein
MHPTIREPTTVIHSEDAQEQDSTLTPQQHFRLLDLPIEIFWKILSYTVTLPGPVCLHPLPAANSAAEAQRHSQCAVPAARTIYEPAITKASKLLRAEALPMFYAQNVFHGVNWSPEPPVLWLKRLGKERRSWMRRYYVSSSWDGAELERSWKGLGVGTCKARLVDVRGREGKDLCVEGAGRRCYCVGFWDGDGV